MHDRISMQTIIIYQLFKIGKAYLEEWRQWDWFLKGIPKQN